MSWLVKINPNYAGYSSLGTHGWAPDGEEVDRIVCTFHDLVEMSRVKSDTRYYATDQFVYSNDDGKTWISRDEFKDLFVNPKKKPKRKSYPRKRKTYARCPKDMDCPLWKGWREVDQRGTDDGIEWFTTKEEPDAKHLVTLYEFRVGSASTQRAHRKGAADETRA
jgi:hypothetical protein